VNQFPRKLAVAAADVSSIFYRSRVKVAHGALIVVGANGGGRAVATR
jgi:hypothetical protein